MSEVPSDKTGGNPETFVRREHTLAQYVEEQLGAFFKKNGFLFHLDVNVGSLLFQKVK